MIPRATYRLQFHRHFTFVHATAIVPYLAALGISHVYASPYLKARAGSAHGYDIIDHNALNPEIGTDAEFETFVATIQRHGMRQIVDIVPNHMGVMQADNRWWLDVLENGRASRYAEYFDIDWEPLSEDLHGKVLLPVLGDQYGTVLEHGELRAAFDAHAGEFSLRYFEHRFPLDPRHYAQIMQQHPGFESDDAAPLATDPALREVFAAFTALGAPDERDPDARCTRFEHAAAAKAALAALCMRSDRARAAIDARLALLNGVAGEPASFDRLHALIMLQSFRIAFWRVASDDINYRRFFDINDLAALRMENTAVFDDTHRTILQWVASGKIDALRIDHPDGLYDPQAYFRRLQSSVRPPPPALAASPTVQARLGGSLAIYLAIEKIVAEHERLPERWAVHGTTGYRFSNVVNGVFVDTRAKDRIDRIYKGFSGESRPFGDILREAKHAIMATSLSSELNVLANLLNRIAKADRHTCDFTLNSLREALAEVVACFPVYRTYIDDEGAAADDRRHIEWAVAVAAKQQSIERSVCDFIGKTLTGAVAVPGSPQHRRIRRFIGRFQQFTSPVMAKGMEDTSFYRFNRLASLNDVGGDPRTFGLTLKAFHAASAHRAKVWPHTMLATSTHDSKRSEDVRARINVLSEMPGAWRLALRRWSRLNRRHKHSVDDRVAPSANDEYLLYQTLLGAWPMGGAHGADLDAFRIRIQAYMVKAVREAKVWTSWITPHAAYERALADFIDGVLQPSDTNLFLRDFDAAQRLIERHGLYNSLSQMVLKLTSPGVPDVYQGTELWDLSLVDPDNRRPIDYTQRARLLDELKAMFAGTDEACASAARTLLETLADGRAKLYVLWRLLQLRQREPMLFEGGDYSPVRVTGDQADHVCAFSREHGGATLLTIVPRLSHQLLRGSDAPPIGSAVWAQTQCALPDSAPRDWRQVFTGQTVTSIARGARHALSVAEALREFPVAVLVGV